MPVFPVRLPELTISRVKAIAEATRCTASAVVVECLSAHLPHLERMAFPARKEVA